VTEVVSLGITHAEATENLELVLGFHPLGDDFRASVGRERDERGSESASHRIHVDAADEVAVELDEVRSQLQDVGKARKAGAGVIDG
jgi:hypothetical protein